MKYRYVALVGLGLLSFCSYMFYVSYEDAKEKAIAELNSRQLILAENAKNEIEFFFQNINRFMLKLSGSKHVIDLDEIGINEINVALNIRPEGIKAISRIDESGMIIYTTPGNTELKQRDVSGQKHVKKILTTHQPVVSDVFTAVQGYRVVAVHVPVFKENRFHGTLAVLIDFLSISRQFLQGIRIGETGYAWMTNREGVELYCPVPGHTGNLVFESYKAFPDIISMAKKMTAGEQGITTYRFDRIREESIQPVKKHAVYLPIRIMDSFWTIVVASSEDELLGTLVGYRNKLILIMGLFLICSCLFSYLSMKAWGIVREEKERRKAEKALRKSQELFKLITGHTSSLFSIHDSNGIYFFASPSHRQLGYSPDELIGKSGLELVFEEDIPVLLNYLEKAQNGELSNATLNYRLKGKDGRIHYFHGSFGAAFTADGSLDRIVSVAENITALKHAQIEKVEALTLAAEIKKQALVGQIAGKMAHDFNNVLGAIMGNTELALLDCKDHQMRERLELIYQQTIRGKNLTKNLVAFAKDQEPKQEYFKIDEKIELVISLLKKDLEGIDVVREYGESVPELLADPGMIEHALVNVVQNSIHATGLEETPRIIIRTSCRDDRVHIEVEDNGCGIPSEFLEKIFDPSFTLKGGKDLSGAYKPEIKGTGYGMSNVKKYIEQHKGHVSVHSVQSQGTVVSLNLPVIKKELTDKEISIVERQAPCSEKYILLVEDEPAISDVQYGILTHSPCNHRVDIAGNGQIAIDLFERNEYDFISLDYILPGKINGMDVYRHIRKTDQTIPILFISGNIEFLESIQVLKQKDPNIDHLSKPCNHIDYLNSINQLLLGAAPGSGPDLTDH